MVNGCIGSSLSVGFEEEIVEKRGITIKINIIAKYCIALIHSQILNNQPNSV
jgi:hypothetical protein